MANKYVELLKMKKIRFIIFILYFIIFCFPSVSYANGAKLYSPPLEQSGIYFDEEPNISLIEENVSFSQQDENSWNPYCKVTVQYTLKNLAVLEKDIKMFFVIPPSNKYSVVLENNDITHLCLYKENSFPGNWIPKNSKDIIDPLSKKKLSSYYSNGNTESITKRYEEKIHGIEIPFLIKESGISKLQIEYICSGGFYNGKEVKNAVSGYIYYLTPAKFWDGSPKITLKVNLQGNNMFAFYSNIPMEKISVNSYETTLTELPNYEWLFSYNDKNGLIFGTNDPSIHTKITCFISILLFGFSLLLHRHFNRKWIAPTGYLLAVVFMFLFLGKIIDGYVGDALIYFVLFLLLVIVFPSVYFINKHIKRKKVLQAK